MLTGLRHHAHAVPLQADEIVLALRMADMGRRANDLMRRGGKRKAGDRRTSGTGHVAGAPAVTPDVSPMATRACRGRDLFASLRTLVGAFSRHRADPDLPRRPDPGELLGVEGLTEHARNVARRQHLRPRRRAGRIGPLLSRLDGTLSILEDAHARIAAQSATLDIGPAGEWLLDNFYVVRDHIAEVRLESSARVLRGAARPLRRSARRLPPGVRPGDRSHLPLRGAPRCGEHRRLHHGVSGSDTARHRGAVGAAGDAPARAGGERAADDAPHRPASRAARPGRRLGAPARAPPTPPGRWSWSTPSRASSPTTPR